VISRRCEIPAGVPFNRADRIAALSLHHLDGGDARRMTQAAHAKADIVPRDPDQLHLSRSKPTRFPSSAAIAGEP